MSQSSEIYEAFVEWYNRLPVYGATKGPARGVIAAALIVLEKMKVSFSLSLENYLSPNRGQISGVSASSVNRILYKFSETREYLREGGRTNRGTLGAITDLLKSLEMTGIENIDSTVRNSLLIQMQEFLIAIIADYHNQKRIEWTYDPSQSTFQIVESILSVAREKRKEGPIAQYLVGAKLQLRFPNMQISNESYSTADIQLGRQGDFFIGNTVFHVTVQPLPGVFEKCKQNIDHGYHVYLLVPDRIVQASRQMAESFQVEKVFVQSLESFIGQNIDEIASFAHSELVRNLKALLDIYNERVEAVEVDKSMMIELPPQLL